MKYGILTIKFFYDEVDMDNKETTFTLNVI
jgi:hypothetical protein